MTANNKTQSLHLITSKGFSLIELLIVMVIIAILASLSIFALQGARASGRDATRKADIESIRSALELYRADCNQYPQNAPSPGSPLTAGGTCPNPATYLEEWPEDPVPGRRYGYTRTSLSTFTICAALEGETTPVGGCASCGSATCTYSKANP